MRDYEEMFGMSACKESVIMYINTFHEDPIRMLGEYTLRAKQDWTFNTTMIDALLEVIEERGIRWDRKED